MKTKTIYTCYRTEHFFKDGDNPHYRGIYASFTRGNGLNTGQLTIGCKKSSFYNGLTNKVDLIELRDMLNEALKDWDAE